MAAPGPVSNAAPNLSEWLPLLGSIIQALCGGGEDPPPGDQADAAPNDGAATSQSEDNNESPPARP
jgi:hypothetical protein